MAYAMPRVHSISTEDSKAPHGGVDGGGCSIDHIRIPGFGVELAGK